jgi:hypothetical protein
LQEIKDCSLELFGGKEEKGGKDLSVLSLEEEQGVCV